ncbi:MAG: type IV secretory system conjugative DNA transfer family protein [Luteimonas sp.]|nr:type IV secretory system conjugative DNA transfer family protein [Luteimonas sp.]
MSVTLLPADLPEGGLLVGWRKEDRAAWPPAGFHYGRQRSRSGGPLQPILYHGDGHLMSIAPTGAGKGVGSIIPALLRHPGSVVVIDPKGENHAVTARRRREMGQQVVLLDPFGVTGGRTDAFNPLDLLRIGGGSVSAALMLASMLVPEHAGNIDPYWNGRSRALLSAWMLMDSAPGEPTTLATLRRHAQGDTDAMAILAAKMERSTIPLVRAAAGILGMRADRTRHGILSTLQSHVADFVGERIEAATSRTDFDLDGLVRGDPLSIYLVIPPHRLDSSRRLLRAWIGALFGVILRRRRRVTPPTLFLLDEAAQLGPLDELRQAITLLRGYGLQTWSFWQDLGQLQELYPQDWQTMYNNCHVHQVFGVTTMHLATTVESLNEVHPAEELLVMDRADMQLSMAGSLPVIARRPDYLSDPCFEGRFESNPFYLPPAGKAGE